MIKLNIHANIICSLEADPISFDVYSKVFNNAYILYNLNVKNQEKFYFVKNDSSRIKNEQIQLQKLAKFFFIIF